MSQPDSGSYSIAFIVSVICPAVYMQDVFVYGTLKKGQPNYFRMENTSNGQAVFLARARTVEPYPLVIATKHNIPFLLNAPGTGQRVYGEIYRVDQKMLEFLDKFEGCPQFYQRTKIQLEVQDGDAEGENTLKPGSIEEAFVYRKTTYESEWLQKPTYESYDANGDHGLKYIDSDTESTPDTSSATQQNTAEPIIMRDSVYTGCGTAQCDMTNPQQ
ncbi:gamma-glutamylaminecyclotransferase C-like isoform X2 [Onychostoma macrolepis]|uniref:gamma-glutamylaminecyclotransferase C-like isoform X2 n=1 Tax=Onychostoma macrolepis TaxID=369639 RepID=UPI00272BE261|nr:gamma-glutamylaminecyclotransferase C-like isoform X2 [Onychostoma macrolepis]